MASRPSGLAINIWKFRGNVPEEFIRRDVSFFSDQNFAFRVPVSSEHASNELEKKCLRIFSDFIAAGQLHFIYEFRRFFKEVGSIAAMLLVGARSRFPQSSESDREFAEVTNRIGKRTLRRMEFCSIER